jgi:hypothetical protein
MRGSRNRRPGLRSDREADRPIQAVHGGVDRRRACGVWSGVGGGPTWGKIGGIGVGMLQAAVIEQTG